MIVFPVCSNGLGTRLVNEWVQVPGTGCYIALGRINYAIIIFLLCSLCRSRVGKGLAEKPAVRLSRFSLDSIKKYLISEQSVAQESCVAGATQRYARRAESAGPRLRSRSHAVRDGGQQTVEEYQLSQEGKEK